MGRVSDFFREQSIPLGQQQRAKMVSLDREVEELEAKVKILESENLHLKAEVNPLKREIERLKNQSKQQTAQAEPPSNPKGHHCDHCGSTKLKRTGSRPHPTFHAVGVKDALYRCLDCQKESAFTNDEAQA